MTERPEYHITGMGWYGCLTAWVLNRYGKTFSWSDTEDAYCAWKASSGLVYPSGDEWPSYQSWQLWNRGAAPWCLPGVPWRNWTERGAFWFASKGLPNGAKGKVVAEVGPIRTCDKESLHVNVAKFVLDTREHFAARRTSERVWGQRRIIAHGFNHERLDRYVWGWTAQAELEIDHRILELTAPVRPSFYLRVGRFQFAYANPLPSTDKYIVGSAHLAQSIGSRHELPQGKVWEKVVAWMKFVRTTTDFLVTTRDVSDPVQGWRPVGHSGDDWFRITRHQDGTLVFPAMGGNGIRCAPRVYAELMEKLNLREGMEFSS